MSDEKEVEIISPQEGAQTRFLKSNADIAIYGGSAGGGKTYALLLDPLYDYYHPGFRGMIFRKTSVQLRNAGGVWDESAKIYPFIGGKANESKLSYTFPSGSKVQFAYMEHDKDRFNYQGAQFSYLGFDELTHFNETKFWYLVSRVRSAGGIKGRIRGTCNPDPDHFLRRMLDWWIDIDSGLPILERSGVIRWFTRNSDDTMSWADTKEELAAEYPEKDPELDFMSFTFIPASVEDNQKLIESDPGYINRLNNLPKVEREQLKGGNWNIRAAAGLLFKERWFQWVDRVPEGAAVVRVWDRAATEETPGKNTPDATAGVKLAKKGEKYYILDCRHFRYSPGRRNSLIKKTADEDGKGVSIGLPQDPGQAGKEEVSNLITLLNGFTISKFTETGDKVVRAYPVSAQVENGNVYFVGNPKYPTE